MNKMVSINIGGDEDIVGCIESLDNNFMKIKRFTEFGLEDGTTLIHINDVCKLNYDNLDLRNILYFKKIREQTRGGSVVLTE